MTAACIARQWNEPSAVTLSTINGPLQGHRSRARRRAGSRGRVESGFAKLCFGGPQIGQYARKMRVLTNERVKSCASGDDVHATFEVCLQNWATGHPCARADRRPEGRTIA